MAVTTLGAERGLVPPRNRKAASSEVVTWRHVAELSAVIVLVLGLALMLPLATTVFALILFGVLHNYFEIRYVLGRFDRLLVGRLGVAILLALTAIVLIRLLAAASIRGPLEIAAAYALLAVVLAMRLRHARAALVISGAVLLVALGLSLTFPSQHFVAITHLHNVLPLVFLWEWTARGAGLPQTRAFRALHLTWAVLLPALILAGALDGLSLPDHTPASAIVGDVEAFVRTMVPPGSDSLLAARLLTVFALLQLMHYYVWCRFFPAVGTEETARFDGTMTEFGLPRGRALTLAVVGLAGATVVLLTTDFWLGRSLYGALAGYHAYLEYALLVLFVLAWRGR